MVRMKVLLFAMMLPLASLPAMAGNFVVGTCKPRLTSFATISAAVTSVPPGSTIQVCPGVYPEQVTISQPLTLVGIASGNQDQVLITVPPTGLTANVTSIFSEPVAAQVLVLSPGVEITNIGVDGTGGDQACSTSNIWLAGIFFASGSSGEVERVRASGQVDEGCGVGIWAENGDATNRFVSIHDSSVHDVDAVGIFAGSGATPTLSAFIRNNVVSMNFGPVGIQVNGNSGVVSQNIVSDALAGIFDVAASVRASSNTITSASFGILNLLGGGTVQNNDISNAGYGVYLAAEGSTVHSNRITSASVAAIEFNCVSATVSHNSINDATIGLDLVPTGFHGSNSFANTGTITTDGCGPTTLAATTTRTQSVAAQSATFTPQQWRTPANPHGQQK